MDRGIVKRFSSAIPTEYAAANYLAVENDVGGQVLKEKLLYVALLQAFGKEAVDTFDNDLSISDFPERIRKGFIQDDFFFRYASYGENDNLYSSEATKFFPGKAWADEQLDTTPMYDDLHGDELERNEFTEKLEDIFRDMDDESVASLVSGIPLEKVKHFNDFCSEAANFCLTYNEQAEIFAFRMESILIGAYMHQKDALPISSGEKGAIDSFIVKVANPLGEFYTADSYVTSYGVFESYVTYGNCYDEYDWGRDLCSMDATWPFNCALLTKKLRGLNARHHFLENEVNEQLRKAREKAI